jgi:general secretion pathway protein G
MSILKRYLRNEKGFTMIEMMVVLIIIAVLIGVGVKFYIGYVDKAKITKAKGDITTMQAALDSYYAEKNEYPSNPKDAGIDSTVLASSGNVAYIYNLSNDEYTIHTRVPVDGTHYVVAKGKNGRSLEPKLSEDTNYPTTP